MDVLIIGSRGREHALAMQLKKDPRVETIFCLPGNGGLVNIAKCIKMDLYDFDGIVEFLDANPSIELTIVNPDELLSLGLVDLLNKKGHRAFGCSAACAQMEASKEFANTLCKKYNIPSPNFKVFDNYNKAKKYAKTQPLPLVVKTNGRTAGKGIMFCKNIYEAENAMYDMMEAKLFGEAGDKVDIEEFVSGKNMIVMCFTDGKTVVPLPAVQNYKRVYDDNLGLNTAGMGATMPVEGYTKEIEKEVYEKILVPTINALASEGTPYKGVLGFNLIATDDGVKVVDFVARFCDVESQVLIPQLETPILDIFNACIDGTLDKINVKIKNESAVCVVTVSGGYPLDYVKNFKITIGNISNDIFVFHSGTKFVDGELKTAGGRVLSLACFGPTKEQCADEVYKNIQKVSFDGMHYRKDIRGKKD